MAIADGASLPLALGIESASPHEIRLIEETFENRFTRDTPEKTIGDKAYDSDPVDERVAERFGTELIAPHKRNRKALPTQDGRKLRRYKRADGESNGFLLGYRIFEELLQGGK